MSLGELAQHIALDEHDLETLTVWLCAARGAETEADAAFAEQEHITTGGQTGAPAWRFTVPKVRLSEAALRAFEKT